MGDVSAAALLPALEELEAPGLEAAQAQSPSISDQAKYRFSSEFWFALVDEKVAADFLGLTTRTMQAYRQLGRGPPFCRLSARCIRYRRIDLRKWSENHLRASTADSGD